VSLSFARTADDIAQTREFLDSAGLTTTKARPTPSRQLAYAELGAAASVFKRGVPARRSICACAPTTTRRSVLSSSHFSALGGVVAVLPQCSPICLLYAAEACMALPSRQSRPMGEVEGF